MAAFDVFESRAGKKVKLKSLRKRLGALSTLVIP